MLLVISLAAQITLLLCLFGSVFAKRFLSLSSVISSILPGRRHHRGASDTDSVRQLIAHQPFHRLGQDQTEIKSGAFGYAFVALWLAAFGFGISGADVLLALTMGAKNRGEIMGDQMQLGAGAYCMSC